MLNMLNERTSLLLSMLSIISVAVVEISVGLAVNSITILSDGLHATFDALVIAMLLIMLRFSKKPRDLEHTYGHGRLETLAGFIGGVMLFIISILIIRESIMRVIEPVIYSNIISIYAVVYAIIIALFRIIILKITNIHDSRNLKVGFYDGLADLGSSTIALISVIFTTLGIYIFDSIGSLILASLLLALTSRLTHSTIMELSDAIDPKLVNKAKGAILSIEGVKACKDIRMRKVGKDILVDVIVILNGNLSFNEAHILSEKIENAVKNSINASMVMVHFEPDEYTPLEDIIRGIANEVEGVKDIHNIIISETDEGKIISMHLQVERSLDLLNAHSIADKVEGKVRERIKANNVTIHIEPSMPEMEKLNKISNKEMENSIREIAKEEKIEGIKRIDIYSSNNIIRIDIHCSMNKNLSIEEVHNNISRLERKVRERLNIIANIHTEPAN